MKTLMEKMVLNDVAVTMRHVRTHKGEPRKYDYLEAIKGVNISECNGYTVVEILQGDDISCVIAYKDGTSDMRIFNIDKVGIKKNLSYHIVDNKLCINRNFTRINVNELIYQAHRIANKLPVELGSYNHYLPSDFIGKLNIREVFSVETGSICSFEQNNSHWGLCSRVYKETGVICSFESHTKAYALLTLRNITEQDIRQYKHIDRDGYIEVLE